MGIFNKLTKQSTLLEDYASEHTSAHEMIKAAGSFFQTLTLMAQTKSYDVDDSKLDDSLDFVIPETPLKEKEFWNAYLALLQSAFGSSQLICEIEENKDKRMSYAFYEALKISFNPIINELTSESENLDDFKMSPSIEVANEKTWMYPFLDYLYKTGNSKEHLEFVMTVDDCVDTFFNYRTKLENSYSEFLNKVIITDWEKFLQGKYL